MTDAILVSKFGYECVLTQHSFRKSEPRHIDGDRTHMAGYSNWVNMNTRILNALKTGQDFTANQLRTKFGIRRVSDRISEIRKAGFAIYLNTRTLSNGNTIKVYRLGTPRRSDVVIGQYVNAKGFLPYDSEVTDFLSYVK